MKLQVRYWNDNIPRLNKIQKGDWIDLALAQDITLHKGEFRLLPLGVSIRLPEGYEALVAPRSSTCKKFGIIQANSIGVIDESYHGDNDQWMMPVVALRDTNLIKGTRICQFRIIKHQPDLEIEEVESLGNDNRGGFGSTGN